MLGQLIQAALGWVHAWVGWYGTFIGDHDDGRAHLRQALDRFRRAGDLPGRACAHLFAARPAARDGDWAEAATLADQALVLFRQAGDGYGERPAFAQLGQCHAGLGNDDLACGAVMIVSSTGSVSRRCWRRGHGGRWQAVPDGADQALHRLAGVIGTGAGEISPTTTKLNALRSV